MIAKIPKHWKIKKLGDVLEIFPTASYSRSELSDEGEVQYIHYGDIHTKFDSLLEITDDTLPKISKSKGEKYETIQLGDLVMVDASEDYQGVGKSTEIIALSRYNTIAGLHTFLLRDKGEYFYLGYKGYITMSDYVKKQLYIAATGTKVYSLSKESLKLIQLPIPPLKEQERITKILLTCDKAIRLTTQIITQLKQRNQGLAQQLLTGEKRIKGFENSVWKEVRLGKIGDTYNGLTGKSKEDFGEGKPYIPYLNIFLNHIVDSATFELVKIDIDDKQNKVIYGDILFTISSETPDEVGMSSVMLSNIDELYLNSFCFGFRLYNFDNLLPQYACYLFRNKDFRREIVRLAQGSTRFNLSKSEFLKTRVFLPTLTEQNAIAQILDTVHQELKLYEQKLQLLLAQKKTLMQKLLTGEILTIK